jgi:hypothetical protein
MWKRIVYEYVNWKEEDPEIDSLDSYMNHAHRLCNSEEVKNWTGGIGNKSI